MSSPSAGGHAIRANDKRQLLKNQTLRRKKVANVAAIAAEFVAG
jgi:hypothetical protein